MASAVALTGAALCKESERARWSVFNAAHDLLEQFTAQPTCNHSRRKNRHRSLASGVIARGHIAIWRKLQKPSTPRERPCTWPAAFARERVCAVGAAFFFVLDALSRSRSRFVKKQSKGKQRERERERVHALTVCHCESNFRAVQT